MSAFNQSRVGFDHMKEEVTYQDLRDIANEGIKAAEADPQGTDLLAGMLAGQGPLVVGMIDTLSRMVNSLLDQLEAAREEQAA